MFTRFNKTALAAALTLLGGTSAYAVGADYSSITGAVDFATVGVGILAIAAVMALPMVVKKGAKMVLGMIR